MQKQTTNSRTKYGLVWDAAVDDLQIEFYCIRKGGRWTENGQTFGVSAFHHYQQAMRLLWPEDDENRWAMLCLKLITENKVTSILGPASSGKTYIASKFALVDYWASPMETCILVSSTDIRGLELRVWGAMKGMFNRALDRYDYLPGQVLEAMHAIATDDINDDDNRARVLNRGIICIPCLQGGRYVGMAKYLGIKQKRLRLISDECQAMGINFLDATSNLGANPDFKAVFLGNPVDPLDPLGMASEPQDGWSSIPEPTATTTWKTRFQNGIAVNLVGSDSPNNDFPGEKLRFPYLISKRRIDEIAAFWGTDSQAYYSQAIGVMKSGLLSKRVITREICRQHRALEKAIWEGTDRVKIYAVDAAYSGTGGDRCVGGWGEFGQSSEGFQILRVHPPKVIPVSVRLSKEPEDQIAEFVKTDTANIGLPIENIFYDSTGRGTLGSAFARLFGHVTPVPVEFGGKPTRRPVRHDLFIYDEAKNERRHKRCDEHYVDFVSELWMSSRYLIECDQLRELPEDVMREGCQREYGTERNKTFVESKHDPKARERMVRSPDLYDWLVTLIEGARQRGFKIQRLAGVMVENEPVDDWAEKESEEFEDTIKTGLLTHK